jgi:serine phosphatase RsbU (regulator of sigma subunit)
VLYSDGITDHMSPSGTEFGRGRLAQVVRTNCGLLPDELIVKIFAELDKFNTVAFDDQSIMVLRVM